MSKVFVQSETVDSLAWYKFRNSIYLVLWVNYFYKALGAITMGSFIFRWTLFGGIGLLLLAHFQNCSSNLNTSQFQQPTTNVSDGLDTSTPNNKPVIDCRFSSQQRNAVFANINSLQDSYSADRFNEDDSVSLDCSNTSDESSLASLKFELDSNYDPSSPNFQEIGPSSVNFTQFSPGRYDMALRVTDPQGESSMKIFSMEVECTSAASATPVLQNPASSISITEGSKVGTYNFSVDTSKLSNGTSYSFAWDFNGDGVMDPFAISKTGSRNLWTSSATVSNQYVNVENTRKITLRIQNQCLREVTYQVDKALPSSHPIARNASSQAEALSYYYLQGDAADTTAGTSSASEVRRRTADYLATNSGAFTKFTCDYKRNSSANTGSLAITTSKQYRDESYSNHGAEIKIGSIPDDGSVSTGGSSNMESMSYLLAGESDGLPSSEKFNKDGACTVNVRVTRVISQGTCSDGVTGRTFTAITLLGEFSCPQLRSEKNTSNTISFENGKFFCEENTATGCPGGGGGGGNPPPQF